MTSVARHLGKFKSPRPSTLRSLAKQDETHATLRDEVRQMKRRQQIERIKRAFFVWRR